MTASGGGGAHARRHVRDDVLVIGGGPAGAVFAARAAQLGLGVTLVERARFPRPHLGESLTPGVRPLLDALGATTAVAHAFGTPVTHVRTTWDGSLVERTEPRAEGRLVDRGAFDAALLAFARRCGVRCLQPATVRAHHATDTGWAVHVEADGATHVLEVRLLVDASGRHGALPARRRASGPRTTALHAYWRGTRCPDAPRIDAGPDAWYWGVPLPDGTYNTLAFVDTASLRTALARPHATRPLDAVFDALLARSGLPEECAGMRRAGPVRAAEATAFVDEAAATATTLKIGDAAVALDPLSSSGVQRAIRSALAGAIVANTLVRRPDDAELAVAFHRRAIADTARHHATWAAGHYATVAARHPSPFWTTRAARDATGADPARPRDATTHPPVSDRETLRRRLESPRPVRLSPDVRIDATATLGDAFVERRPAVHHPGLDGAVAFVDGVALAPLLEAMRDGPGGETPMRLARRWSAAVPLDRAVAVTAWLLRHGVLVESSAGVA